MVINLRHITLTDCYFTYVLCTHDDDALCALCPGDFSAKTNYEAMFAYLYDHKHTDGFDLMDRGPEFPWAANTATFGLPCGEERDFYGFSDYEYEKCNSNRHDSERSIQNVVKFEESASSEEENSDSENSDNSEEEKKNRKKKKEKEKKGVIENRSKGGLRTFLRANGRVFMFRNKLGMVDNSKAEFECLDDNPSAVEEDEEEDEVTDDVADRVKNNDRDDDKEEEEEEGEEEEEEEDDENADFMKISEDAAARVIKMNKKETLLWQLLLQRINGTEIDKSLQTESGQSNPLPIPSSSSSSSSSSFPNGTPNSLNNTSLLLNKSSPFDFSLRKCLGPLPTPPSMCLWTDLAIPPADFFIKKKRILKKLYSK